MNATVGPAAHKCFKYFKLNSTSEWINKITHQTSSVFTIVVVKHDR